MARRWVLIAAMSLGQAFTAPAWQQKPQPQQQEKPKEMEPPEEDEAAKPKAPKEYTFNPLQSNKEIQVGVFYTKRGAWKSAQTRFEEATKWDPTNAEAWYRYADACDRLKEDKPAREAWAKYLEVAPDGKYASTARKRLAGKK